jgi:hypothetical protein
MLEILLNSCVREMQLVGLSMDVCDFSRCYTDTCHATHRLIKAHTFGKGAIAVVILFL